MKRIVLALAIGASLVGPSPALSDWDTSIGPHIDTNPLPHRRHRLACPIKTEHFRYCRDSGGKGHTPSAPSIPGGSDSCMSERIQYLARHPDGKPRALRWAHGCELYRADRNFHSAFRGNATWSVIGLVAGL